MFNFGMFKMDLYHLTSPSGPRPNLNYPTAQARQSGHLIIHSCHDWSIAQHSTDCVVLV